jgi:cell division septal protein FtsQ
MASEEERSSRRLETQMNIAIMVIVAKVACLVVFVLFVLYMLFGALWFALTRF